MMQTRALDKKAKICAKYTMCDDCPHEKTCNEIMAAMDDIRVRRNHGVATPEDEAIYEKKLAELVEQMEKAEEKAK